MRKHAKDIKLPPISLAEPDDYYVYYVILLDLPDELFWDADMSLLLEVAATKGAFSEWLEGEQYRIRRSN